MTFVEDFCVKTKRPEWLIIGIEIFSVVLFIGDALVIVSVIARIVFVALRGLVEEVSKR
jgi:hypothetical protein